MVDDPFLRSLIGLLIRRSFTKLINTLLKSWSIGDPGLIMKDLLPHFEGMHTIDQVDGFFVEGRQGFLITQPKCHGLYITLAMRPL